MTYIVVEEEVVELTEDDDITVVDVGIQGPAGTNPIWVGDTPPSDPEENQLWFDTSLE